MPANRLSSCIVILQSIHHICKNQKDFLLVCVQCLDTLHLHIAFRYGSCLIQTQGIHACQCFNAVQLLHQRFALRQIDGANRQCNACQ